MQQEISLDQWTAEAAKGSGVTLEHLEELIKKYRAARDAAEKFRVEKTRIEKEFSDLEGQLIEAMEQTGKSKVYVEGAGTMYFIDKMVVATPKTNEDKIKLFDFITKSYGQKVLIEKVSVNHQTLQSLYNNAAKEFAEKCESDGKPELAATFHIPGLQAPTNQRSIGFRKD
jgi:predicted nuclease with TOPRIM domain